MLMEKRLTQLSVVEISINPLTMLKVSHVCHTWITYTPIYHVGHCEKLSKSQSRLCRYPVMDGLCQKCRSNRQNTPTSYSDRIYQLETHADAGYAVVIGAMIQ